MLPRVSRQSAAVAKEVSVLRTNQVRHGPTKTRAVRQRMLSFPTFNMSNTPFVLLCTSYIPGICCLYILCFYDPPLGDP